MVLGLVVATALGLWLLSDVVEEPTPDVAPAASPMPRGSPGGGDDGPRGGGTVIPDGASARAAEPAPLSVPSVGAPPDDDGVQEMAAASDVPMRVVSGSVRRASDGSPLPGVTVRVPLDEAPGIEVATGQDPPGSFLLSVPQSTTSLVVVSAGPWPERTLEHAIEPGPEPLSDLVLTFDSGFRISGRVTDEHDTPIPGATVDVNRKGEVTADERGNFLVYDVAPAAFRESVEVGARAPGYQRGAEDAVVPEHVSDLPEVHVRIRGGGTLEGRVTRGEDEPEVGASVRLVFLMNTTHGSRAQEGLETLTDVGGGYRIDHIPAGRYVVEVDPTHGESSSSETFADGAARFVSGDANGDSRVTVWSPDVGIEVGETTRLDVLLSEGARIAGRVTDPFGSPVADAEVKLERSLRWPAPDLRGSSTTTSSELRIVSREDPEGGGETVLTTAEQVTRTDDRGAFSFRGVMAGEKLLSVLDTQRKLVPLRETLTLRAAERLTALDLVMQVGITLRSRVVDASGVPLEAASVQVRSQATGILDQDSRVETDHDGRFALDGLTPGEVELFINKSGYNGFFGDVDASAPPPEFTLAKAPRVHGRVTDALRDEPITSFTVMVAASGNAWSNQSIWENGEFGVDVNSDEPATVSIRAPGYEELTFEQVLPSDTAVRPLEFQLHEEP